MESTSTDDRGATTTITGGALAAGRRHDARVAGEVVSLISDRWSLPVLLELAERGRVRRADLWRAVGGVSQKVLTGCLRRLESHGLVRRHLEQGITIAVSYELTDVGWSLVQLLGVIRRWADEHAQPLALALDPVAASAT